MKSLFTFALTVITCCGVSVAADGPLSPVAANADYLVGTPGGMVAVSGAAVTLLSDASANATTRAVLSLAAPARIVGREGFAVLLYPSERSAPLFPDQELPKNPEGCGGWDYGVALIHESSLVFRRLKTDNCEDWLTSDGRALVRHLPVESGKAVELDDLLSGKNIVLKSTFVDDEGKPLESAFEQRPQLGADDTVLWPSNNVLALYDKDGSTKWAVDSIEEMITHVAFSADRELVLVSRLDCSIEARRVSDGGLFWLDAGNGTILEALRAADIVTEEQYEKQLRDPSAARLSDIVDVQPTADGWLIYGVIGAEQAWVAHVFCDQRVCRANLVRPDVLRTEGIVTSVASGNGEKGFALDTDLSLLHRQGNVWGRVR
ncbi:MAG: hypothetical protein GXP47_06395 [Acidobacteria bacterium]|nr:hypothetical protein [Acidobacteriota bacterium]